MFLFQVTSRFTYSRAVIAARSEREARERRPDGAFWRNDRWSVMKWRGHGFTANHHLESAPDADWWPDTPEEVEVRCLGRAEAWVAADVIAHERSVEPREEV